MGVWDAGCGVMCEVVGTRTAGSGAIRECDLTDGRGVGIGPELAWGRTCEAVINPALCFFASPGGMHPELPGEHPHPVLLP